jgi:hypothetical protein
MQLVIEGLTKISSLSLYWVSLTKMISILDEIDTLFKVSVFNGIHDFLLFKFWDNSFKRTELSPFLKEDTWTWKRINLGYLFFGKSQLGVLLWDFSFKSYQNFQNTHFKKIMGILKILIGFNEKF